MQFKRNYFNYLDKCDDMPNAKGLHYGSEVIKNREIAKILYDIGELLELSGESKFKALAYKKASKSIELLTQDIEVVCNPLVIG